MIGQVWRKGNGWIRGQGMPVAKSFRRNAEQGLRKTRGASRYVGTLNANPKNDAS